MLPAHIDAFPRLLVYYLDNLASRFAAAGGAVTAERAFRQSLNLAPRSARIHYNLGTFVVKRDRTQEALTHLDRAIELGWTDADAYVNRGVARWHLGSVDEARRDFEEALSLDPRNPQAIANLRRLLEQTVVSDR